MKRFAIILSLLCLLFPSAPALAQQDEVSSAKALINDYSMIGVNYGVGLSTCYFNPSRMNTEMVFSPNYLSITYTKHSKMFGAYPYFALVVGLETGSSGYKFVPDKTSGYLDSVDGANECRIRLFNVPAMMQIHYDVDPLKLMLNVGLYGGWRSSIERSGEGLEKEWENNWRDYERRIDYGLQGGLGVAFMFDPIEIHFNCGVRWSWSSLYEPDYYSRYYYRYTYPIDITASVGLHFQLGRRRGRSRAEIKKEAYEYVYGKTEDNPGEDR